MYSEGNALCLICSLVSECIFSVKENKEASVFICGTNTACHLNQFAA